MLCVNRILNWSESVCGGFVPSLALVFSASVCPEPVFLPPDDLDHSSSVCLFFAVLVTDIFLRVFSNVHQRIVTVSYWLLIFYLDEVIFVGVDDGL